MQWNPAYRKTLAPALDSATIAKMAEQAISMGLNAVPLVTQHYDKVTDPIRHRYKKATGQLPKPDPHSHDHRTMEEKGYVLRKRSEVASDEEIVDVVRHRGEVVPRKPRKPSMNRRSSSFDDARDGGYRGGAGYDSEGSVPPRSRTRAKSQSGRSRRRGSSTSSTSSSELGSTDDERKECKKMQRKKWITAALASVATIHAAQKVYSSIEAHDKRIEQVKDGKISPEEARKQQKSTRWQDAAAIGIAALGIKGAYSEWKEVREEHKEHLELMHKQEENHQKRLEHQRRKKAREQGGYYKGQDGHWYYDGTEGQNSEKRKLDGPRNGERKLLEGPRGRGRGSYDDDSDDSMVYAESKSRGGGRDRSRARSAYTDDRARSRSAYTYNDDYRSTRGGKSFSGFDGDY